MIEGNAPFSTADPVTIGHEAVGEVVEMGKDAKGFSIGDKIGFLNGLRACWNCEGCDRHYGFCQGGKFQMQGFSCDGFMQEYCLVDPKAAFVLPDGIDVVRTAPLCCAGITAYHGVKKAQLQKGQWLAVVGCGGLGQLGALLKQPAGSSGDLLLTKNLALRYAKAMGLKVIAIDIDDKVLAVAEKAGVEHTFNTRSTPDTVDKIKKITGGGADSVVVFTAVKAGYDLAPKLIKVGRRLVCVGCPPGQIGFDAVELALERFTVHGANNHATPEMSTECAEFTKANKIDSPVELFKIDQIGEMIEMMEAGKMGGKRLVVDFS